MAGVDMFQGARILVTILFGVSILLVGLSIYKISHSLGFACLGALFLAVSDLHLGVYSFALSEPSFLIHFVGCLSELECKPRSLSLDVVRVKRLLVKPGISHSLCWRKPVHYGDPGHDFITAA